jgi:uncharacterized iron-regulated protein
MRGAQGHYTAQMPGAPRLALGLVLLVSACTTSNRAHPPAAHPPDAVTWQSKLDVRHPLVATIWDVAAQRRVDEAELTAHVQAAEIVLVGETHEIRITTGCRPR